MAKGLMSGGSEPQEPEQRSIRFNPGTLCIQADDVPAEGCFKIYERHAEHNVQGMSLEMIN
jgi:hypothetical protein